MSYIDVACCWWLSSVICLSVCHVNYPCKNGWTNRDAIWDMDMGGPEKACIRCSAHWRHLVNVIEQSMHRGNAALCQITFEHLFMFDIPGSFFYWNKCLPRYEMCQIVMFVAVAALSLHRGFSTLHSLGSSSYPCCYLIDVSCSHNRPGFCLVSWMASHAHFSYGTMNHVVALY